MHPPGSSWKSQFAECALAFALLRPWIARLEEDHFPDPASLTRLARIAAPELQLASAAAICFVDAQASDEPYELAVHRNGCIPCRHQSWHDLFNALVWLTFPQSKRALNVRHVQQMRHEQAGRREAVRDALTQFDEDGVAILSDDAALLQSIRDFQWKELFWRRRRQVEAHLRFIVFGHALYDKLRAPFIGITGKGLLMQVEPAMLRVAPETMHSIDAMLARMIADPALRSPRDLAPLPILGVPGWYASNTDESFYDHSGYFRPGRGVPAQTAGRDKKKGR